MSSIISRINRLLNANVNHAIDRAEQPEAMLNQLIRELTTHYVHVKQALVKTTAWVEKLHQRKTALQSKFMARTQQIETAVRDSNDAFAKDLLKDRKQIEQSLNDTESQYEKAVQSQRLLNDKERFIHQRLEALKQRRTSLLQRLQSAKYLQHASSTSVINTGETFDDLFERMEEKVIGVEADFHTTLSYQDELTEASNLDERASLAAIDSELAEIKASIVNK